MAVAGLRPRPPTTRARRRAQPFGTLLSLKQALGAAVEFPRTNDTAKRHEADGINIGVDRVDPSMWQGFNAVYAGRSISETDVKCFEASVRRVLKVLVFNPRE